MNNKKLFITLIIALFVLVYLIFNFFNKIETKIIYSKCKIIKNIIISDLNYMLKTTIDWAQWDNTVNFIKKSSYYEKYIKSNISTETLKNLDIDFMIFLNRNNIIKYYILINGEFTKFIIYKIRDNLLGLICNSIKNNKILETYTFLKVKKDIYMITLSSITKSNKKHPVYGTLIFGKKIDNNYLQEKAKILAKNFKILLIPDLKFNKITITKNEAFIPLKNFQNITLGCLKVIFYKNSYIHFLKYTIIILITLFLLIICILFFDKEKKLKEKLNIIYKAVEQAQTGIILTDFKGRILYVNNIVCKITNYSLDEILGKKYNYLLEDNENKIFRENLLAKKSWHGKIKGKRKNGEIIELEAHISPVFDENRKHRIKYFITTCEYISEHKKYIYQLKKEKETIQKFIIIILHKINTLLTGIKGFIDLLEDTNLNNSQKNYISFLKASVIKLESIFNYLNNFMCLQEMNKSMELSEVKLKEFIKEFIINIYKLKANRKGLLFKVRIEDNIPEKIIADSKILKRIIGFVMDNAIKFTEKGEVEFICKTISLNRESKIAKICFIIKDTGIGIEKEKIKDILNLFETSEDFEDIGLGLFLAKKYIEALNGELLIDGETNKGIEVRIVIDFKIC